MQGLLISPSLVFSQERHVDYDSGNKFTPVCSFRRVNTLAHAHDVAGSFSSRDSMDMSIGGGADSWRKYISKIDLALPGETSTVLYIWYGRQDQVKAQGWCHYPTDPRHTCSRSSKMNAFIERFNCTVQEDFAGYRESFLLEGLRPFNGQLFDYLDRYNGHWLHHAPDYRPPNPGLTSRACLKGLPDLFHVWWRRTFR